MKCKTVLGGLGEIYIGGSLVIYNSDRLTDLATLAHVTAVQGDLGVSENGALQSLEGLQRLSRVEGDLVISANPLLNSLEGLRNLNMLKGRLEIRDNPALPTQSAQEFAASIPAHISDEVIIEDNLP